MEWWQILLIVLGSLLFLFLFFKIVQWDKGYDVTIKVADKRFENTRSLPYLASDIINHGLDPNNSQYNSPELEREILKQQNMTSHQRGTYLWSMFGENFKSNNGSTTYGNVQKTEL